ncbi:hypothetical protein ACOJBM_02205 [Rhizobium beringeri]
MGLLEQPSAGVAPGFKTRCQIVAPGGLATPQQVDDVREQPLADRYIEDMLDGAGQDFLLLGTKLSVSSFGRTK